MREKELSPQRNCGSCLERSALSGCPGRSWPSLTDFGSEPRHGMAEFPPCIPRFLLISEERPKLTGVLMKAMIFAVNLQSAQGLTRPCGP